MYGDGYITLEYLIFLAMTMKTNIDIEIKEYAQLHMFSVQNHFNCGRIGFVFTAKIFSMKIFCRSFYKRG